MAVPNFAHDLPDSGEEFITVAPPVQKARFAERSQDDVASLIQKCVPGSTRKTIDGWLKVFRDFCAGRNLVVDLAKNSSASIAKALPLCNVNASREHRKAYQKPSLMGLRAAVHRHLQQIRPGMNICSDSDFQLANNALDARLKELLRDGDSKPAQHKAIISDSNMAKLNR